MNTKIKKIFITGASGFIGSHLLDSLIKEQYEVTVLLRPTSNLRFLPIKKVKVCYGDIREYENLKNFMKGCDTVFHVAALAADWGEKKDFYEINVIGAQNVINAANEQGIKRIVFISTNAVLGEEDEKNPKPETASYKPKMAYFLSNIFESDMNYYRETKMLAEKESIKIARENNLNLVFWIIA